MNEHVSQPYRKNISKLIVVSWIIVVVLSFTSMCTFKACILQYSRQQWCIFVLAHFHSLHVLLQQALYFSKWKTHLFFFATSNSTTGEFFCSSTRRAMHCKKQVLCRMHALSKDCTGRPDQNFFKRKYGSTLFLYHYNLL